MKSLSEAGRANAAVKRAKLSERLEPLRARIESVDAPFRQSRAAEQRSSRGLLALYEFGKSTSAEIADSTGSGGVLKLASADAMFAARTGGRFIVRSPLLLTSKSAESID